MDNIHLYWPGNVLPVLLHDTTIYVTGSSPAVRRVKCWANPGPTSTTLALDWSGIGSKPRCLWTPLFPAWPAHLVPLVRTSEEVRYISLWLSGSSFAFTARRAGCHKPSSGEMLSRFRFNAGPALITLIQRWTARHRERVLARVLQGVREGLPQRWLTAGPAPAAPAQQSASIAPASFADSNRWWMVRWRSAWENIDRQPLTD